MGTTSVILNFLVAAFTGSKKKQVKLITFNLLYLEQYHFNI